jgi:adenylate cyclase
MAAGAPSRGSSAFVGREREIRMMDEAFEEARSGSAPVVGVVGEAGVGKSRLCREFTDRHRRSGVLVLRVAGQAHARSVPLLPVLELLRGYFEIGERDADADARDRIASRLSTLDARFEDDLPLLFEFLGVADPGLAPQRMDPEARQRRLLGFMKRLTRAQSARQPTIVVIEDLQWLDTASEVFLAGQVEAATETRGLLVLNFRPEYRAAWMSRSYYRQIAVAPLAPGASEELLAELLGSDSSLAEIASRIRERAQGNPFFIEELVRALVESESTDGSQALAVPPTVQAVLAARIDRLEPREKDVLQAAAVIGKEFPAPVLERVVDLDPAELAPVLGELVAREFVYEQQLHPDAVYAFKHPLTQEVAYGSQLTERRSRVHAATARAIAELAPGRLDERAALLAHHWESAGDSLEAARWHARAAAWAGTANAAQALVHWARVRELAAELPESSETHALAVAARIFALHYGWRVGISLEDSEAAFKEGDRLATGVGDDRARALLVAGYAVVTGLGEGDVREYARLQREAVALAEQSGDPALRLALAPGAYALFCSGDYREGVAMCDRGLELGADDPTLGAGINFACPYAQCHALKAFLLVSLGRLDEARQLIAESARIANEHDDVEVVGFSHLVAALVSYFAGYRDAALADAQQALALAERTGGSWFRANAWLTLAMAEGMHERWGAAVDACDTSLTIAREGRTVEVDAWRHAMLAESYLGIGDPDRACALAATAVARAREMGQVFNETFANLVLGRVLLGAGRPDAAAEAEAALKRALDLARTSQGRAFEPLIHRALATVAGERGDRRRHERELADAQRLFTEIAATGHAEHLRRELQVGI